jgi:AmmeMemoRadiSam system protein B
MNLDFLPSPDPDRPGLLIRDPLQYSQVMIVIPPGLVRCLECFDGESSDLDLRQRLVEITGDLAVGELQQHLTETLSSSGFLHDEAFARMQEERRSGFAQSPLREAAHAGSAYPAGEEEARGVLTRYLDGASASHDGLVGIAAPHVSPEGGWQSYRAAYNALGGAYQERTFVILGTSHYGEPEKFGLTCKPFVTPYGRAEVDRAAVERLATAAPGSVIQEDYCHAIEHSIEFQVIFLQHLFGAGIRILPVLCGPFARSIYQGGLPESDAAVAAFFDALGEMAAREGNRLLWVLGIDMAHMGRRYGDAFTARAGSGPMEDTEARDRARIDRVKQGDADGFWRLVQDNHDDLKWCGSSPVYTFLKAVPQARGELLRYEQWNIDPQSVVSFAGMAFRRQD